MSLVVHAVVIAGIQQHVEHMEDRVQYNIHHVALIYTSTLPQA